MIRVSRLTDYAVLILTQIAKDSGPEPRVFNARDLANRTHLPLPTVGKILKELARAKLLSSARGLRGGYRLARAASDLRISDIVTAMEGPISVTDCAQGTADCVLHDACLTRSHWQLINTVVVRALEGVSLQDLSRPSPVEVKRSPQWEAQTQL